MHYFLGQGEHIIEILKMVDCKNVKLDAQRQEISKSNMPSMSGPCQTTDILK